jgi:hypothetical protein
MASVLKVGAVRDEAGDSGLIARPEGGLQRHRLGLHATIA